MSKTQNSICTINIGSYGIRRISVFFYYFGGKQISAAWMIQELCDLGQLTDAAERGWLRVKRHITAL